MGRTALSTETASSVGSSNAIELLMEDHRRVRALFAEFQRSTALLREKELAVEICDAIRLHADIEEDLVYPALAAASDIGYQYGKATANLRAIRDLIAQLEPANPTEETFHCKVYVLCQMFYEHVEEEEAPRGLLATAARSGVDLVGLGDAVRARRLQRYRAALRKH